MTTTAQAFQWVLDNAETMNFNHRAVTAQTISRSGVVKTVSRGGQVWRFEVKPPDGPRYSDVKSYLEALEAADRYTPAAISTSSLYGTWFSSSTLPSSLTVICTQFPRWSLINRDMIGWDGTFVFVEYLS